MLINNSDVADKVITQHAINQFFAREVALGILGQQKQQFVFAWRQVYNLSMAGNFVFHRMNGQRALVIHNYVRQELAVISSSQNGLDSCHNFPRVERLHDIIIGPMANPPIRLFWATLAVSMIMGTGLNVRIFSHIARHPYPGA